MYFRSNMETTCLDVVPAQRLAYCSVGRTAPCLLQRCFQEKDTSVGGSCLVTWCLLLLLKYGSSWYYLGSVWLGFQSY